jgi:hypothetical protein
VGEQVRTEGGERQRRASLIGNHRLGANAGLFFVSEESMSKKEDKLHQKRLRRLANQIVGQLPEEFDEAVYVLDYTKKLITILEAPEPSHE